MILIFAALQTVPAQLSGYPFVFSDTHVYYNAGEAALGFALEQIGSGAPQGGAVLFAAATERPLQQLAASLRNGAVQFGGFGRKSSAMLQVLAAAQIGNGIAGGALSEAHHSCPVRLIWLVPFLAEALASTPGPSAARALSEARVWHRDLLRVPETGGTEAAGSRADRAIPSRGSSRRPC